MKKCIVLAMLLLAVPVALLNARVIKASTVNTSAYVLYGYQTLYSYNSVPVTVYVSWHESSGGIIGVDVIDQYYHSLNVIEWDGTIEAIGGTLYATGFRVNFYDYGGTTFDYVVLSGALTMA